MIVNGISCLIWTEGLPAVQLATTYTPGSSGTAYIKAEEGEEFTIAVHFDQYPPGRYMITAWVDGVSIYHGYHDIREGDNGGIGIREARFQRVDMRMRDDRCNLVTKRMSFSKFGGVEQGPCPTRGRRNRAHAENVGNISVQVAMVMPMPPIYTMQWMYPIHYNSYAEEWDHDDVEEIPVINEEDNPSTQIDATHKTTYSKAIQSETMPVLNDVGPIIGTFIFNYRSRAYLERMGILDNLNGYLNMNEEQTEEHNKILELWTKSQNRRRRNHGNSSGDVSGGSSTSERQRSKRRRHAPSDLPDM